MTQIRIELDDRALGEALERLVQAGGDLSPLMDDIGAAMLQSTRRRFETQSGPDGAAWPPLAKRTLAKRGPNAQALRLSGRLYQSIHAAPGRDEVVVGTNTVYAAIHQFGGAVQLYARSQVQKVNAKGRFSKRGRTMRRVTIGEHAINIPARPFLGVSTADVATIARLGREFVADAIGGEGQGGAAG